MGYLPSSFGRKSQILNEPIKTSTGHYTDWVHGLEGELVLYVNTFHNVVFTDILNFHYLFIYLALIYVTTIYYMFTGERDWTDSHAELSAHLRTRTVLSVFQRRSHQFIHPWKTHCSMRTLVRLLLWQP